MEPEGGEAAAAEVAAEAAARDLWDFSVEFYARPGVAEACLELQDRDGLNVGILLFGVWLGLRGCGVVDRADFDRLALALQDWNRRIIDPIRAMRRDLKVEGRTPTLRVRLLDAELEAERHAQRLLLEAGPWPIFEPGSVAAALANLETYAGRVPAALGAALRRDDEWMCG